MSYVRIRATHLTVGQAGLVHNVMAEKITWEREGLCLADVSALAACEVRSRWGKFAPGNAEVLELLPPRLAMGGTFFLRAVVRWPGLRVARSPIRTSEGMSPFIPYDALMSGYPLQKDMQMSVGCHIVCQLVMDVRG